MPVPDEAQIAAIVARVSASLDKQPPVAPPSTAAEFWISAKPVLISILGAAGAWIVQKAVMPKVMPRYASANPPRRWVLYDAFQTRGGAESLVKSLRSQSIPAKVVHRTVGHLIRDVRPLEWEVYVVEGMI